MFAVFGMYQSVIRSLPYSAAALSAGTFRLPFMRVRAQSGSLLPYSAMPQPSWSETTVLPPRMPVTPSKSPVPSTISVKRALWEPVEVW